MLNHPGRIVRLSGTVRCTAVVVTTLFVLSTLDLPAQRRGGGGGGGGGGSVRQTRSSSANTGASRSNNYNRSSDVNRNNNVNRNTNVNNNVNINNNVNVNRNVNAGGYYGRPGGVVAGEEGAVAVGRRGAVAVGEEGFVGVGRYGGVVGGEYYDSYEGWRAVAGVTAGIAIGTMLARPPTQSVTIVAGGTNYMYSDGAYYEQVFYEGQPSYRVVAAPPGAIIATLPGGCTTTVMNGMSVSHCGTTYYQRVSNGYKVVVF